MSEITKDINDITTEKDTEAVQNEKRRELFMKMRKCFWVAIAILAILLILSTIVLVARMTDYFMSQYREVSLNSAIHRNELDIFDIRYKNESGEITVEGLDDGMKVIAPGTDVEYTIRVRNIDRIAIDYELYPSMEFTSEHKLPLWVRILDHNDQYIVGSAKEWVPIENLNGAVHRNTIMRGECVEYTFQWKWPFESGDDATDTTLGNLNDAGVTVSFTINAAANIGIADNGGLVPSGWGENIAIFVLSITLLIAILLLIISVINKKLKKEEPTPTPPAPEPVIILESEPEPDPEPVVISEPTHVQKESFDGKMEYINIDVLQENFESGDLITLKLLKEKGLIDPSTKQMKVLARNGYSLDKALIIETQGISAEARKIVKEAGGVIVITKG